MTGPLTLQHDLIWGYVRSRRALIAVLLVAVGVAATACSSDTTNADSYWDACHTGYKIAADYAKRTG